MTNMKKRAFCWSKFVVISVSLCLLAACKNHEIVSQAANITSEPKRLYVIVSQGTDKEWNGDSFKTAFAAEAQNCGVQTAFYVARQDELSLENEASRDKAAVQAGIQEYKPDYILQVLETGYTRGSATTGRFSISLESLATKTIVWRAGVSTGTADGLFAPFGGDDGGARLAKKTMMQMKQDGVFRSCATSGQ